MQGEVHDPRAHAMGGMAGHAGLFSTARTWPIYAQMMINHGTFDGHQILSHQYGASDDCRLTGSRRSSEGWAGTNGPGYSSNRGRA